jgi:hypothetical protein
MASHKLAPIQCFFFFAAFFLAGMKFSSVNDFPLLTNSSVAADAQRLRSQPDIAGD